MKKRINLFSQRISSRRLSTYFTLIHRISLISLAVLLVILLAMGGTYWYLSQTMGDLTKKKETYDRFIVLNESFNDELQRFVFKYNVLKAYLADDAQSYAYYERLQQILNLTSSPKTLKKFDIDNQQQVSIVLQFTGYEDAIQFIEEIETTTFLDNFSGLTLSSFNAISSADGGYDIELVGTFSPKFETEDET